MRSLSSPVCPHFSLRGSRLPGESGLTQLALIARLVTHRVPIQPFHLRVGYATILLKATLPQNGPFRQTLKTTDTRRTLFLNPSPSSTTTSITEPNHTRLSISFSTAFRRGIGSRTSKGQIFSQPTSAHLNWIWTHDRSSQLFYLRLASFS
jgi:hypothetical protein